MKFIYVTMNISRLDPFKEILDKNKFKSYQIIEQVSGRQFTGSPRMNSAVWPGHNSVICIQCEEDRMAVLLREIRLMNSKIINESERIMAVVFPCEEFVYYDETGVVK